VCSRPNIGSVSVTCNRAVKYRGPKRPWQFGRKVDVSSYRELAELQARKAFLAVVLLLISNIKGHLKLLFFLDLIIFLPPCGASAYPCPIHVRASQRRPPNEKPRHERHQQQEDRCRPEGLDQIHCPPCLREHPRKGGALPGRCFGQCNRPKVNVSTEYELRQMKGPAAARLSRTWSSKSRIKSSGWRHRPTKRPDTPAPRIRDEDANLDHLRRPRAGDCNQSGSRRALYLKCEGKDNEEPATHSVRIDGLDQQRSLPIMARPTCEGCTSIDVRRWHREGRLHAGRHFFRRLLSVWPSLATATRRNERQVICGKRKWRNALHASKTHVRLPR
jgi:hypothetical protein